MPHLKTQGGMKRIVVTVACIALPLALLSLVYVIVNDYTGTSQTFTAQGTITNKYYKPATTYSQNVRGASNSYKVNKIPIAESYGFDITIEGIDKPVGYSLNTIASKAFQIGQRVNVTYTIKKSLFSDADIAVLEMKSAD